MSFVGWVQILTVLVLVVLAAIPLGELIVRIIRGESNLTPIVPRSNI